MVERCAVTEALNRYLAEQEKDDAYSEAISDIVTELTAPKGEYYPFTSEHICEAVSEMSSAQWLTLAGVLRDHLPTSSGLRDIVEKYWTDAAEAAASEIFKARIERAQEDAAADKADTRAWERDHGDLIEQSVRQQKSA
jgi:hypothetical protein